MNPLLAWLFALFGNFLLSLGMALQKRHVGWIHSRDVASPAWRRHRARWALGFLLMNLQPLFNYLALLGLPPNVVGAASGTNLAFSAFLAWILLRERLGFRRGFCIALIFAAAGVAGLRGEAGEGTSIPSLLLSVAIPLAGGAAAYLFRNRGSGRGAAAALAASAGALGGSMVLSLGALQLELGPNPLPWLTSPLLYAYLVAGFGAFVLLQAAYRRGELASVSPVFYGMQVLWPSLASYAAFGSRFDPVQALAFALIGFAVILISRIKPRKVYLLEAGGAGQSG